MIAIFLAGAKRPGSAASYDTHNLIFMGLNLRPRKLLPQRLSLLDAYCATR
jgi:hypothetical protein